MYQVIARKYRPQTFAELISQEHVKTTLENAITQRRIAHGYIFSGQRGTGKTTVARILARCLNCEQGPTPTPCGMCASCIEIAAGSCMDVIEIDAASNRGINEMRELRENVRFRPARDRYKVFIVDEAHQITSEAFNALLKTLEEPPEWVVFMLCTTESHKIPVDHRLALPAVQFPLRRFRRAGGAHGMDRQAGRHRGRRGDAERAGAGRRRQRARFALGARSGHRLLRDQARRRGSARRCWACSRSSRWSRWPQALAGGDSHKMLDVVAELEANGRSLQHFARELARYFRNLLVVKIAGGGHAAGRGVAEASRSEWLETAASFSEEDLTRYLQVTLDLFRDLQSSLQPRLHLEMGLLRMVHAGRLAADRRSAGGLGRSGSTRRPIRDAAAQASRRRRGTSRAPLQPALAVEATCAPVSTPR